MRQIITYSKVLSNKNFILWFLINNFPEGVYDIYDNSIAEIIEDNCVIEKKWIDDLTGYYDGIFDVNDGYIDNPKTINLHLSTGDNYFIEFHPGDTLYYINDKLIGCTGPDYSIKKITLKDFFKYTDTMKSVERLLLLPMIKVCLEEKKIMFDVIRSILQNVDLQNCNINDICVCIFENCLE